MSNKDKKNGTSFKSGNKAAEKWTFIKSARLLLRFRDFVLQNNFKSVQKALFAFGLYPSKYDYIVNKYPVFKNIKRDVEQFIIAELNENLLEPDSKISAAGSIWRFKQLGEIDKQETNLKNDGGKFETQIIPTKEEIKNISDNLDDV